MVNVQHIPRTDLLELLDGNGESEKTHAIGKHLHECEKCRIALDVLAAQPATWQMAAELLKEKSMTEFLALPKPGSPNEEHPNLHLDPDNCCEVVAQFPVESLLDPPKHPEMLGRVGEYDIEREIGRGGMGVVLKAYDAELNRPLAIKVLAPHLATHGTARKRFAQEARAAAGVLHPNVIAVHGVNIDGKTPFIVMPYVSGPSLQTLVDRQGPLTELEIVRMVVQISSGLAAAHSQGLVHRDIKPANILVEAGVDRVLITDFGLARAEDDASLTRTGWLAGTPNYMSPEQTRGERPDQRSDLFSLGSLIYFLSTGRLPFRSESPLGVLNRIQNDEPTPVRQVNNQISKTLADVIELLIRKNPEQRFQTSAELHELLEKHLAFLHQPDISNPPIVRTPGQRVSGLRRTRAIMVFAFAVAMLLLGWGYYEFINGRLAQYGILGVALEPEDGLNEANKSMQFSDGSSTLNADSHSRIPETYWGDSGRFPQSLNDDEVVTGDWDGMISASKLRLTFSHRSRGKGNWNHNATFALDDFMPAVDETVTGFKLKRKFGSITFTGNFSNRKGEGEFHFDGDDTYRQYLVDAGIKNTPNDLLYRLFFGMHEGKFLSNLSALKQLDLSDETLQVLMVEVVDAGLVQDYLDKGLSASGNLSFILARVNAGFVQSYIASGLDPNEHADFVKGRVSPQLLVKYNDAGLDLRDNSSFINAQIEPGLLVAYQQEELDLSECEDFIHSRVEPELLTEYRLAGLDMKKHKDAINNRIKPAQVKAYMKAGLDLTKYEDFINNKVNASLLIQYKELGYDPLKLSDFVQNRVPPSLIKSYEDSGFEIEKHKSSILDGVDPEKIENGRDR